MSTPTLSRQRVSRACDSCRRKKVKCDGATPVCTNCKGIGLQCTFNDLTKKRGPPKGYIEAIENRLYKLESFLGDLAKTGDTRSKQLMMELNSPLETSSGEQIRSQPTRRIPRSERNKVFYWQQDGAGKRKRASLSEHYSSDDGYHEDSPADEGQLAMDENGQVRYLGKSSGYYLLQNSKSYHDGAFHFNSHINTKTAEVIDPLELPPKDLSAHLFHLYFTHFYPFLPLFHKKRLFENEPASPLLLNSIYAIASRISDDVRVRSDPALPDTAGNIFFERAQKLLDDSYDKPSISTVQALILLASHQHGAMKSPRAWLYSGMAFRMAQDLGLHRNCNQWNISPDERERRKRVFWCCYVVDKLTSAMYGRASTLEESDCDVPLPSVDDDDPISEESNGPPLRLLQSFTNLIKICDILGHVLRNIYYARSLQNTSVKYNSESVMSHWNDKLQQWYQQLPDALQLKEKNTMPSVTICQLHMIYHTTIILLHRPFIPGPNQTLIPKFLPTTSVCAAAADDILHITDLLFSEDRLKYMMNYAVYYIFTAGIILVKNTSKMDQERSLAHKLKVDRIMRSLHEIQKTWITATKSSQILAELSGLPEVEPKSQDSQWEQPIRYRAADTKQDISHLTMDPFAAPGIIHGPSTRPFDPLGTAFWGVPASLDINEWNNYMGTHQDMYSLHHEQGKSEPKQQHLIHKDQNVDVLSGIPLEHPASTSNNLLGFVDHPQHRHPNDGRPSTTNTTTMMNDVANAFYW
ncbi:fungal-specific transcription factor domain-containing protein [Pilobolus umbonatus]|nr:fungal-specific transcription factor domain-containing protein [Pilobolus umbonatus]